VFAGEACQVTCRIPAGQRRHRKGVQALRRQTIRRLRGNAGGKLA